MIARARIRVPEADLRVGDLQTLPVRDDAFDLVTGFGSFFYAGDVVSALTEAARVARPGGAVVVQVFGRPEHCDLEALKRAAGRVAARGRRGAHAGPGRGVVRHHVGVRVRR